MAETAVMAPSAGGAAPAAQLARLWFTALAVSEDERPADPDGMPMDAASAQAFLTAQSAALLAILLGRPVPARARPPAVGHALVQADFVSADVLGRSLRVLILRLPELLRRTRGRDRGRRLRPGAAGRGGDRGAGERLRARAAGPDAGRAGVRHARRTRRAADHQRPAQAPGDPRPADRAAQPGRGLRPAGRGARGRAGPPAPACATWTSTASRRSTTGYGHEAGDELLVTVARRIGETARACGAVAGRIGGDEFVVVAEVSPGIAGLIALAAAILGESAARSRCASGGSHLGVRRHRRAGGRAHPRRDPDRRRRRRPLPGEVPRPGRGRSTGRSRLRAAPRLTGERLRRSRPAARGRPDPARGRTRRWPG